MEKEEKARFLFRWAYLQFKWAHEEGDPFKHEAGLKNLDAARKLEDEL